MNKLFTIFFIFSVFSLSAQDCKTSAGTKTLYTQQQLVYTSPPAGYRPVFINHVGRHGARHLTKDLATYFAFKMLIKADSLHALTKEGERLKKMVLTLSDIEAPYIKSISERGKKELEGIALRMIKNNETIIGKNPLRINVEVTKEIRTSQSAAAFLNPFKQIAGSIIVNETIDDTALRFYDLSPAYLNFEDEGNWKSSISAIMKGGNTEAVFKNFSDKFFNTDFILSGTDKEGFCKDIYGFAMIVNSIANESAKGGKHLPDLNFRSFFSCDQLLVLSKADQAEDFLLKGPGSDSLGVQVKIAAPLLVQFIKTTEAFIQENNMSLQLRFAHAETIAPFAALMQIKSASGSASKIEDFDKAWKADEVIPLSANIQWIFYQNKKSKDFLVKFLLNEKEVALKGLNSRFYPFYNWNDVKKFYLYLLKKLDVGLNDNMNTYLLKVK